MIGRNRGAMCAWAIVLVGLAFGCGTEPSDTGITGITETTSTDATTVGASTSSTGATATTAADTSSDGGVRYDLGNNESTQYLLSLSTPLDTELPLQFIAEITVADAALTITLQPLALAQGSTSTPRDPVGEVLDGEATLMTPAFSASFEDITIPGDANPIDGEDLAGTIELVGSLAGTGAPCGTAQGMLASTFGDLAGSTWAATPIDDIDALPTEFASACP